MKACIAFTTNVQPTIGPVISVQIDEYPSSWCTIKDSIMCIGFESGRISYLDSSGEFLQDISIEGPVVGLVATDDGLIAASGTKGLFSMGGIEWELKFDSGCESIIPSNSGVFAVDGSGNILHVSSGGDVMNSRHIGPVDIIEASENGLLIGLGLIDGRLMILDEGLQILHESLPADDDVETISCIQFRTDEILIVGRNSLGMTVDDRPENRLECWSHVNGMINTSEMPSKPTSFCATEDGVMVGCFNGELVYLTIGIEGHEIISQMDYKISDITRWGNTFLVSYWFETSRISSDGVILWQFENHGIVEGVMPLDNGLVAIFGDDKKSRGPSPIQLIDPESPPIVEENLDFIEYGVNPGGSEFSGGLTEDELDIVSRRGDDSSHGDGLIETLNEEIEISLDDDPVEVDALSELIESAKSLNIPPVADAGDDRTINSDEGGKATILLDGSRSYDPDGNISDWLWLDRDGKEIGDTPQLRVRISRGVHNFSLLVIDDGGAQSRASITIQVR